MEENVYIQLLNEGTQVYRPVPSYKIKNSIYKIGGFELYDPEDEVWEFPPGTHVLIEERSFDGQNVLVAIQAV